MNFPAAAFHHLCVWIDHREAKVFGVGLESTDKHTLIETGPHHHIHRKADHVHAGKDRPDQGFLDEVADRLTDASGILIVGPGSAKTELASFLKLRFPGIAQRIWEVRAMDHPTDGQIVSAAREFFHGAERMR